MADHALSEISEEMIKFSFFKCIQEMNSFTLVLNHFLCCLILFIFPKVWSKIGVLIVHGRALCTWMCFRLNLISGRNDLT